MSLTDVVIVTAAAGEDDAVRLVREGALTPWTEDVGPGGYPVWNCMFKARSGRPLRVVLGRAIEQRSDATAIAATALVQHYRPHCLAIVGVCAGRPGWTELGDVIIADRIYRYDAGERQHGRRVAHDIRTYLLDAHWEQAARRTRIPLDVPWVAERPFALTAQREWLLAEVLAHRDPRVSPDRDRRCADWKGVLESLWADGLFTDGTLELTSAGTSAIDRLLLLNRGVLPERRPIEVKVGPLATGSDLVQDGAIWAELAETQRLVLGLDMEAAAIGVTAHTWHVPYRIAAKAVMDFAEQERVRSFFPFAARASAEVLIAFLREHLEPRSQGARDALRDNTYAQRPSASPSALLNARYQVVPFDEELRAREIAALDAWCESADSLGAYLVHGPGGVGKTRLLVELCRRYRDRGWAAGFLPDAKGASDEAALVFGDPGPVLVVVDYAETRPDLRDFLRTALDRSRTEKLRVVLLARAVADWWAALAESDDRLRDLLERSLPMRVTEITPDASVRERVFLSAGRAFAEALGKAAPIAGVDLSDARFSEPLYIHMAALAAVEGLPLHGADLANRILDHEERFWLKPFERGMTSIEVRSFLASARRLVAALTLRGGAPSIEVVEALGTCADVTDRGPLIVVLRDIFPGSGREAAEDRYIASIQPDLLGETLVARVLSNVDTPERFINDVLNEVSGHAVRNALTVLGRLAIQDDRFAIASIPRVLVGHPARTVVALEVALALGELSAFAPVGDVVAEQLLIEGTSQISEWILSHVPVSTVSLSRVAVWASRRSLADLPPGAIPARAAALNNLSVRLAVSGDQAGAVTAAREAVELFQALSQREPPLFAPFLATALDNLARSLYATGDSRAAEVAARRAVDRHRELAATSPASFDAGLAKALDNLGNILGMAADHPGSLAASREASAIYRRLVRRQPHFSPRLLADLASNLHNLGVQLSEAGLHTEALAVAQEAATLHRSLVDVAPDAFSGQLAASLLSVGNALGVLGRHREAGVALREATDLYRRLAKVRPEPFASALALSLQSLAVQTREFDPDEAIVQAREATDAFRVLADKEPQAYRPRLAAAISCLANAFGATGDKAGALRSVQEAVGCYRELAQEDPKRFRAELAVAVNNLAGRLGDIGDLAGSVAASLEAVALCRTAAPEDRDALRSELGVSLHGLSIGLTKNADGAAALAAAEEATGIFRELESAEPGAFAHRLADSLHCVSKARAAQGDEPGAFGAAREATELLRKASRDRPSLRSSFAHALDTLRSRLIAKGDVAGAVVVARETTERLRELAGERPAAFLPPLASSLLVLGQLLHDTGDHAGAVGAGREATSRFRELAVSTPEVFREPLVTALFYEAVALASAGDTISALASAREAAQMRCGHGAEDGQRKVLEALITSLLAGTFSAWLSG